MDLERIQNIHNLEFDNAFLCTSEISKIDILKNKYKFLNHTKMSSRTATFFLIVSILLFALSLSQITYCVDGKCAGKWSGLVAFITGIFGFAYGGACFTWFANPFIILSWASFKQTKLTLIFSIVALIIGLSFLLFNTIIKDEAGNYGKITGYGLGYYLWILSFASMVVANVLRFKIG